MSPAPYRATIEHVGNAIRSTFQSIDDIQIALDAFMERYNRVRPNQGKHCRGRTPEETFLEGIELYQKLVHTSDSVH